MSTSDERRAHPRSTAPSYIRVVHVATATLLGDVEDISVGGFRLRAAAAAELGTLGQDRALRLEPCVQGASQAPIHIVACLRWQRPGAAANQEVAGFEFTRLSQAAVLQLDAFMQALAT